jgi:hypothetical protein
VSHSSSAPDLSCANRFSLLCSKVEEAQAAGRTTNYGCISRDQNKDGTIAWNRVPQGWVVPGTCLCDNWFVNELADTVLEAMPMVAQVCAIIHKVFQEDI